MKKLGSVLIVLGSLALIGTIATFVLEASYASRAKTYQIVKPTKESALFGEVGEKIGTPQSYVIDDPRAVLPETLSDGTLALDDNYLKENNIYPLQLKTVRETVGMVRVALAGAAIIFASVGILVVGRSKFSKA